MQRVSKRARLYDFNWYIRQGISPNLKHLQNALIQYGPWQGQANLMVDLTWLKITLQEKIDGIDWKLAGDDVERFLNATEQKSLNLWSEHFFSQKLLKLV